MGRKRPDLHTNGYHTVRVRTRVRVRSRVRVRVRFRVRVRVRVRIRVTTKLRLSSMTNTTSFLTKALLHHSRTTTTRCAVEWLVLFTRRFRT